MAIQIRHSTDVSFQRLGKFNLTVHVNKKFTERWGQGCGLQVERVIASNVTQGPAIQKFWRRGLPKPCRENTNTDCYGSPSEPSLGKAEKEKMGFEPCHQERLSMVIGKEKKKRRDDHVRYSKLPCREKHGLVVSSGRGEQKVCSRFSLLLPLWPWESLLTSLCLLICKTGILVFNPLSGI